MECNSQQALPIPNGYVSYDPPYNRFIRSESDPANGPLQINPAYISQMQNSSINWAGFGWDMAFIIFSAISGGVYSPGLTVPEGMIAATGAGLATQQELAHTDFCIQR